MSCLSKMIAFAGLLLASGLLAEEPTRESGEESGFRVVSVSSFANGIELQLSEPLARGMGWEAEEYTYAPADLSDLVPRHPKSASVSADRKTIFLEVQEAAAQWIVMLPESFRSEAHRVLERRSARAPRHTAAAAEHALFERPAPPPAQNGLSDADVAAGWKLLFDGKSTASWRGFRAKEFPEAGWVAEDGCLKHVVGGGGGDIITTESFVDFEFECEWKVAAGGNSGVMYRVSEEGGATWSTGPEMQVLDDEGHPDGKSPLTSAGALYALVPCRNPQLVQPAGQWNHARIKIFEGHVEHWLNGELALSYELGSPELAVLIAASKFASMPGFAKAPAGHIALQDHGDEVCYRNLRVRRLGE